MIIAFDGPAGSGKSTIAKIISEKLGITYLDTGAMYRAVTLYFLENNVDFNEESQVKINLEKIELEFINNKTSSALSSDVRPGSVRGPRNGLTATS